MTIPRLELIGTLIAARLCSYNVPEASKSAELKGPFAEQTAQLLFTGLEALLHGTNRT